MPRLSVGKLSPELQRATVEGRKSTEQRRSMSIAAGRGGASRGQQWFQRSRPARDTDEPGRTAEADGRNQRVSYRLVGSSLIVHHHSRRAIDLFYSDSYWMAQDRAVGHRQSTTKAYTIRRQVSTSLVQVYCWG